MSTPRTTSAPTTQALLRRLSTPRRVQRWLDTLTYNPTDSMRGLTAVAHDKSAHCLEAAVAAAVILESHGWPPLLVDLQSVDLLDHTLFVYQLKGRWGAVAKSRDVGLDGRRPVFQTLSALARSYAIPYIDAHAALKGYGLFDLRTLDRNWQTAKNIQFVEDALNENPHHVLHFPSTFVHYWRQRYITFKRTHPRAQPNYFPDQETWM